MKVLGVDGCAGGWVGIVLGDNETQAHAGPTVAGVVEAAGSVELVAVDIPICLPMAGPRAADLAARVLLGPRRSSVFLTPMRRVIEEATFAEANNLSKSMVGKGITQQAFALRSRILEIDRWAPTSPVAVYEVHPEVSFLRMAECHLTTRKVTWNGALERRRLLEMAGIALPDDLGQAGNIAGIDDVLDAAAAAWTGRRIATGQATSYPDPPEDLGGWPTAIWA